MITTNLRLFARILTICSILFPSICFAQDADQIAKLISTISYGVPASPAFELLPEKPDEVTHIVTPHDLHSNISNILNGTKLRTGVAFDGRPLSYFVGSLKDYRADQLKRILWRSVLSLGTAPAEKSNKDVFVSTGLRISLIDQGDPRANEEYITSLENAYAKALEQIGPPDFKTKDFGQRSSQAAKMIEPIRDSLSGTTWNALKLDAGVGVMWRATGGYLDSLSYDRWGLWVATGVPLGRIGQLTLSGKSSWVGTDSANQESNRLIAGSRLRIFLADYLAGSIEGARVWSRYSKKSELNESWNHFAILLELEVSFVGGWIGIAYGGDTSRREKPDAKFALNYAIYANRILKR